MRMRKITETTEHPTLESAMRNFLSINQAQMLSNETMRDYQAQLERFVGSSRNGTEYNALDNSVAIPCVEFIMGRIAAVLRTVYPP